MRIRTVSSDSSLSVDIFIQFLRILKADNEDPDQTARMRRLIWVYAKRKRLEGPFRLERLINVGRLFSRYEYSILDSGRKSKQSEFNDY